MYEKGGTEGSSACRDGSVDIGLNAAKYGLGIRNGFELAASSALFSEPGSTECGFKGLVDEVGEAGAVPLELDEVTIFVSSELALVVSFFTA